MIQEFKVVMKMKEKHIAFLVSILAGAVAGVLAFYYFFIRWLIHLTMDNPQYVYLRASVVTPLLVMGLSLILAMRFSTAWKEIRTRTYCIVLSLITYMLTFSLTGYIVWEPQQIYMLPLTFFALIIFGVIYGFILITFKYSSILTIVAAYVATMGMKDLRRRVVLAVALMFLICLAAAVPLAELVMGY
jgi:hypothetical protein